MPEHVPPRPPAEQATLQADWSKATMRRAGADDAARVAALLVDAYRSWTDRGLNPKAATYTAQAVIADLTQKEVRLLEDRAKLVGTVTLRTRRVGRRPYLYVTHLATPPPLQKCGLASSLMSRVEAIAHERRIHDVRLDTAVGLYELVGFYVKRGYRRFGEHNQWPGTNYKSQHFRKLLAATRDRQGSDMTAAAANPWSAQPARGHPSGAA